MLIINPVQDKTKQADLCAICGIEYRVRDFAFAAYVDGEFVGLSQFYVTDEWGMLENIVPAPEKDDIEAMFILGRQTLNWIDLLGIHTCRANVNTGNAKLLKVMGFVPENDYLVADMTHMFDGHCGGNCDIAAQLHQ